ncbi:flagellar basal body rod protein FlgC [Myxococcota bacterium]|nr:flagellar basal body rod protein FlgC [Myxococcota bacterium]
MDFFTSMEISASGLAAERLRMNVASANLANASTTETAEGGPYKRREVVLATQELARSATGAGSEAAKVAQGVDVADVVEDARPPRLEYDPGHPNANADGYVAYPNVNPIEEMVDMITASRAYEAGLSAMSTASQMAERALGIGR